MSVELKVRAYYIVIEETLIDGQKEAASVNTPFLGPLASGPKNGVLTLAANKDVSAALGIIKNKLKRAIIKTFEAIIILHGEPTLSAKIPPIGPAIKRAPLVLNMPTIAAETVDI